MVSASLAANFKMGSRQKLMLGFLLVFFTAMPLAQAQTCQRVLDKNLQKLLTENKFNTSRDLMDYLLRFGPQFQAGLKSLKPGQIWMDLGAGKALAQRDFIRLRQDPQSLVSSWESQNGRWQSARTIIPQRFFFKETWPTLIAVSHTKPENLYLEKNSPLLYNELNWSQDKEKFSDLHGQVDLLTDYYGNLSYSEYFSQDLKSYLQLLSPGGGLYVSLEKDMTLVETPTGEKIDILTWLTRQQGIEVRPIWTKETLAAKTNFDGAAFWDGDSFEIRLRSEFNAALIPDLDLVEIKVYTSGPPKRILRQRPLQP